MKSRGTYNTNSQIKFETSIVTPILCDYNDAHILFSRTITITEAGANDAAKQLDERNKGVTFKNCAAFTDCISDWLHKTQIDHAKYIDVVMELCGNITEMIQTII